MYKQSNIYLNVFTLSFVSKYKVKLDTRKFSTRVNGDNIYSSTFVAHSLRVLGGIDICIALLDDPQTFDAQLAQSQAQHIERKITGEYFQVNED